jgi:hypothetical protein
MFLLKKKGKYKIMNLGLSKTFNFYSNYIPFNQFSALHTVHQLATKQHVSGVYWLVSYGMTQEAKSSVHEMRV